MKETIRQKEEDAEMKINEGVKNLARKQLEQQKAVDKQFKMTVAHEAQMAARKEATDKKNIEAYKLKLLND